MDDPPFWFKALAAVALVAAAYLLNDDFRAAVKKSFAPPSPTPPPAGNPPPTPSPPSAAEPKASPPLENPPRNPFQKAFALPGIGGLLGTFVGAILPFALAIILIPLETRRGTYGMAYIFAAIAAWNLVFTLCTKDSLRFLFIPLWLWSLLGLGYAIYEAHHPS